MAAPPEIKVRITGDTKGLEDAGNKVAKTLKDVNASISRLEKEIADNIRISRGYAGAVEELNKELKNGTISQGQYQKALSRLRRDEKETEVATKELRRELSGLKQDSRNLQSAALGAAGGQSALSNQIKGTTPTLLEFNRVIQDAPFGIQGVGNNIQQLVANFQVLRQNAGSTKAAFSALLGSFAGPAGILFVVSAATSLLTVYADRLFKTAGATNELNKATLDFAADARAEISTLKELLAIAGNETESREKRAQAVQILQDKYPQYLKNLTTENTTTQAIKKSVDELTKSLELRARVQGAQELLTQKAKEALESQQKAQDQYQKTLDNLPQTLQRAQQANASYARGLGGTAQQVFDVSLNEARQREIANERLKKSLSESESEYQKYVKNLTQILSGADAISGAFGKIGGGGGKTKEIKPPKFAFSSVDLEGLEAIGVQAGQTLQKSLSAQQNAVRKGMGDLLDKPLADSLRKATPQLETFAAKFDVVKEAGIAFSSAIGQGFSQLGSLISNSLQTGIGVLDIFVSTLVNGIAQLAASFAQKALIDRLFAVSSLGANLTASNANAITIATSAAAGLGPLGLAALPGFLSGTLATVNAAFAAIPKFAQGGIVGGGSFTGDDLLARLNSGERVLTIQDQGILTRVLQGNLRNMGEPAVVTVEGVIRGNDILIANRRAERNNRRFGR